MTTTPAARRQIIGTALRRQRQQAGYQLDIAARILRCDKSKISRIETGHRGIRAQEVRKLLTEYGASDTEIVTLTAIAHPARANAWWRGHTDTITAAQRDYYIMESAATTITIYRANHIPGLLQTPAYTAAVLDTTPPGQQRGTLKRALKAAGARHDAIVSRGTTAVNVIIGEATLHQQIGGSQVLRDQLSHLNTLAAANKLITIQVLPFTAETTAPASITLLEAGGQPPALTIVHLPGFSGGTWADDPTDVIAHANALNQLRQSALSPQGSACLLAELAGLPEQVD